MDLKSCVVTCGYESPKTQVYNHLHCLSIESNSTPVAGADVNVGQVRKQNKMVSVSQEDRGLDDIQLFASPKESCQKKRKCHTEISLKHCGSFFEFLKCFLTSTFYF